MVLVGHSLGGGLAKIVGARCNKTVLCSLYCIKQFQNSGGVSCGTRNFRQQRQIGPGSGHHSSAHYQHQVGGLYCTRGARICFACQLNIISAPFPWEHKLTSVWLRCTHVCLCVLCIYFIAMRRPEHDIVSSIGSQEGLVFHVKIVCLSCPTMYRLQKLQLVIISPFGFFQTGPLPTRSRR